MAKNKKKLALNALTLGGVVAAQVGLFANPASATNLVVTNCDDDSAGSLRWALQDVNMGSTGATITFDPSMNCDTIVAETPLRLDASATIEGPGIEELRIVAGEQNMRGTLFINRDGETNANLSEVNISGLTIEGAFNDQDWDGSEAIQVGPDLIGLDSYDDFDLNLDSVKIITGGGTIGLGIRGSWSNAGSLTVTNSEFEGATNSNSTSGIETWGALDVNVENTNFYDLSGSAVRITSDSFDANLSLTNVNAVHTTGVGVQGYADLWIDSSFFSSPDDRGVAFSSGRDLEMKNTTVVGNVFAEGTLIQAYEDLVLAQNTFDILSRPVGNSNDGAVIGGMNIYLYGNIIASEQSDGILCWSGFSLTDLGANLVTNEACNISDSGANTDGTSAVVSYESLDLQDPAINTSNPANSGIVQTIALGENSVARDYFTYDQLDLGDLSPVYVDARGVNRPFNGLYDVGAYEAASDGSFTSCAAPASIGKVKFDAYSSKLTKASKAKLREFAQEISASGCGSVLLKAHTSTDFSKFSWAELSRTILSQHRANKVKKFLKKELGKLGVTVDFQIKALGKKNPVATNKSATGRAKNRRVEIIVRPSN